MAVDGGAPACGSGGVSQAGNGGAALAQLAAQVPRSKPPRPPCRRSCRLCLRMDNAETICESAGNSVLRALLD